MCRIRIGQTSVAISLYIGACGAVGHMDADDTRFAALVSRVKEAACSSPGFTKGIRGLKLNLDELEAAGAQDRFMRIWEVGVPLKAQPAEPLDRRNHPSLLAAGPDWAYREWDRLEKLGKVEFLGPSRPPRLNISPCALILKLRKDVPPSVCDEDRFKARLIVDLLRGRVNDRLPKVEVAYGTVEMAVDGIHPGDFLFVIDLKDAFFNWRVEDSSAWELGFYSPGHSSYGRYLFLPFGLSSSPGLNDASIKEVLRLLEISTGVKLLDFVDDLFGSGASKEEAWGRLEQAVTFFLKMGIPVSDKPSGIRKPAQRQLWIGWVFDTVLCEVTVEKDKCERLQAAIAEALEADGHRELRARRLAEVAGLASHIAEISPQGRRRLHPVWSDLNAVGVYALWAKSPQADPVVHLPELSRANFRWWITHVETPPRRALHNNGGRLSAWGHKSPEFERWPELARSGAIKVIETDASKLVGWSYHLCDCMRVVSGLWPADFSRRELDARNANEICFKELWVVRECLRRERDYLRGWRVLFRVDNVAAEHYVNVRYGDVPSLEDLAASMEEAEQLALCWALARHLKGKYNHVADMGSRDPEFHRRWASDVFKSGMLRKDLYARIEQDLSSSFSVDLFADRRGWTALAPTWRCPEVTAFEFDCGGHTMWLHPPRDLVFATLKWLKEKLDLRPELRAAVLLPEDPCAPWFRPNLLGHLRRKQRWPAGSDLFRWAEEDALSPSGFRFRRGPRSDKPYVILVTKGLG